MSQLVSAVVDPPWDFAQWRALARLALGGGIAPETLQWIHPDNRSVFDAPGLEVALDGVVLAPAVSVPKSFIALAETVICHRASDCHALLYRLLWRLCHGERHLMSMPTDSDVRRAHLLFKEVRRDCHKMKAFVRFREVAERNDNFVAWFEPDHRIVDRIAPFFARRFTGMRWAILTPYRSVCWDGAELHFGRGASKVDAPSEDSVESLWVSYYANIFNPARVNPKMMTREMPRRYWSNLPETQQIDRLLRESGQRVHEMAIREAEAPRRRIPSRRPQEG